MAPELTDEDFDPDSILVHVVFDRELPEELKANVVSGSFRQLVELEVRLHRLTGRAKAGMNVETGLSTVMGEVDTEEFHEVAAVTARRAIDEYLAKTNPTCYAMFANPSSFSATGPGGQTLEARFLTTALVVSA